MSNKLMTEIKTFLDKTGFTQYQQEIGKMKQMTQGLGNTFKDMFNFKKAFGGLTSNPFLQIATGYFTVTGAIGQYNKMVEASNKQISLEVQMDTALKAQGYVSEQIQALKDYAGELQNAGIIGDEASMTAIKSMASFKLKEETIKDLLPQVHNLMIAEKGLNSTEADAEKWSKSLAIAISSGQTRALKQAGIVFDEHKQKVFESANEQQRASMLYKELTERIGDQNAEILKTPEGKIINAQNRIGDVYERFGGILRETRGKFWSFMADNLDTLAPFTEKVIKALTSGFDTGINTVQFLFRTFSNMPNGVQNAIKLLTGFFLIKKFPIVGGILILEDLFAAFQGKDSLIEDVFDKMTGFFNSDYKFADLRQGVWDFWTIFTKGSDSGIERINLTTKILSDLLDIIKAGSGLLQMIWGATGGLVIDTGRILTGDFENVGKSSFGNIKGGWDRLHGAGLNMNKTGEMYEKYKLDEAQKKQQKQTEELAKYYEYAQKKSNNGAIPLAQNDLSKKLAVNNKTEIINKPVINMNVTMTNGNKNEIEEMSRQIAEKVSEGMIEKAKIQYGGNGSLAY